MVAKYVFYCAYTYKIRIYIKNCSELLSYTLDITDALRYKCNALKCWMCDDISMLMQYNRYSCAMLVRSHFNAYVIQYSRNTTGLYRNISIIGRKNISTSFAEETKIDLKNHQHATFFICEAYDNYKISNSPISFVGKSSFWCNLEANEAEFRRDEPSR